MNIAGPETVPPGRRWRSATWRRIRAAIGATRSMEASPSICGNTSRRNASISSTVRTVCIFPPPVCRVTHRLMPPPCARVKCATREDAMEELVRREDAGAVALLTLDRPQALNALSTDMMRALQARLDDLATETAVRAVVLRVAGRAFCAGHDLREMQGMRQSQDGGREAYNALFAQCSRLMSSIPRLPQPVIAEVHGIATAAGCQLVAACDMAVAAEGTRFGVNGVNIGLFCSTPMVALSRNIPRKQAFEMLTTGRFVPAEEAERMGLVNTVVPADDLAPATQELAQMVASKLGAAVKIGKQAFYEQAQMGLDDAYAHTGQVMVENMLHRDTEEGIAAFLEKRPPEWSQ